MGIPCPLSAEAESSTAGCDCQFPDCECPELYYSKASNREPVTFPPLSLETTLVTKLRQVQSTYRLVVSRYIRYGYDQIVCPICGLQVNVSSPSCFVTVIGHLKQHDKQLSEQLVAMLDTRQLEPGEFMKTSCLGKP